MRWKDTLNKMKTTSFLVKKSVAKASVYGSHRAKHDQSTECRLRRAQQTNAFIITSNSEYFCRKICISYVTGAAKYSLVWWSSRHCRVRSSSLFLFFLFVLPIRPNMYANMFDVRAVAFRVLCASLLFRFGRSVLVFIAGAFSALNLFGDYGKMIVQG